MDESFEVEQPSKSIRSLPESIKSLLGFNTHLTPSWVETVCCIINDLPGKTSVDSLMKTPMIEQMDSNGYKDAEVDGALSKIRGDLASLHAHLKQLNLQRRQALNDFLDLKGNIRVFCRIRPFLSDEKFGYVRPVIASDSSDIILKIAESKSKKYTFDKIFHPQSTQDEVFSEIEPVIKSALDGYNVCIFAYGQTGTGKTFTMEGRPDCPGVVPRGIEALFEQALNSNYKFLFTFSMLEIYMGSLRDLLVPHSTKLMVHKAPCLSIQMDPNGGIEIENLLAIKVSNFEQVNKLYRIGRRLRSTASTMSNSTSSRSHCLIRISVTCSDAPERRRETNRIWMVDLGGSERLLKTQARGKRLEEGKAINLSLSALGDVISALQSKKPHVPYRNSKLTQVLRDSLGSDSKTLMLVHVSPKEEDLCETICSLGFATRAMSIHLGHEEPTEVRVKKEVAMAELLKKVKHCESARQEVRRDIEKLNERLKLLTGIEPLSAKDLEASQLSTEGLQLSGGNNAHNVKDFTGGSTRLPRFMRPTVCSRSKTGVDRQTSVSTGKKPPVPSKRRKSSSVYAESVASPEKGIVWQSDCGSECSASRISALNWKYSGDNGTECSQDASEYDIKMVIFPEQEKSPMTTLSHASANESENGLPGKTDQKKYLTIDNWLYHQLTEQTSTCAQWSKRVLPIPTDKTGNRCNEQNHQTMTNKPEVLCRARTRDLGTVSERDNVNDFTNKELNCLVTEEQLSDVRTIEGSPRKEGMNETVSSFVGPQTDITDSKYHQNMDSEHTKLKVIQREFIYTTMKIELLTKENIIKVNGCSEDLFGCLEDAEDIESSCLRQMTSQRSLFMARDLPTLDQKSAALKDPIVPVSNFHAAKQDIGPHNPFGQTVQMFWGSALLGLGIYSLGLGHDFFHGLMF